ncbi:type VI secretion protein [Burkholderia sp. SRS-46]|nr:type VI secretion protein [Burkholderia sp. SRS-46]
MWANSSAGGQNEAMSVNMTPPVGAPVPYQNVAQRAGAVPNVPNVILVGGPAHNAATVVPSSSGDAGGAMGGVSSGTVGGTSRNPQGSGKVILSGMPVTRMTDQTQQNTGNTSGSGTSPSQLKVLVLS